MKISEQFSIGVDIGEEDLAVVTVLKQNVHGAHIVNVFQGQDAIDFYNQLITLKKIDNGEDK